MVVNVARRWEKRPWILLLKSSWPIGTDLESSTLSPNELLRACNLAFQKCVLVEAPLAQCVTVLVL